MTVRLRHQLTGYDRETDFVGVEYVLDPPLFSKIRKLVNVDPGDPAAVSAYPIDGAQLRSISDLLGKHLDNDKYEFFLEPIGR
ncbi:MAG TPA: hypothetical protein VG651_13610 [Stellaceae bacterium]|nr:hypothetical protein [Stellaceae bacterium]